MGWLFSSKSDDDTTSAAKSAGAVASIGMAISSMFSSDRSADDYSKSWRHESRDVHSRVARDVDAESRSRS
jgi:hypothetical protein